MNILKLVLLTIFRLALFGVALVIYTLFLPDSPLAGVAQDGDGHTGDTAANAAQEAGILAAQEAGILPASLRRDAFSS